MSPAELGAKTERAADVAVAKYPELALDRLNLETAIANALEDSDIYVDMDPQCYVLRLWGGEGFHYQIRVRGCWIGRPEDKPKKLA